MSRKTTEYRIWCGMNDRCTRPANNSYRYYGARGIRVCDRWSSFENFLADMGPRPSLRHSIDRLDPYGNYEPSNCRWATIEQQNRNKSTNKFVQVDGQRMTIAEASRALGIPDSTLRQRVAFDGRFSSLRATKAVRATFSDGSTRDFQSAAEAAAAGYQPCNISLCLNGRRAKHRGATWERLPVVESRSTFPPKGSRPMSKPARTS